MGKPYRIRPSASSASAQPASSFGIQATAAPTETSIDDYLEKLLKMVPAEVVGLYLVGSGVIPSTRRGALLVWSVFCLAAVVVVRVLGTRDGARGLGPQWGTVGISAVAFVIWVYSIGGPFVAYLGDDYEPFIGSLLILAWTFVVPLLYKPRS